MTDDVVEPDKKWFSIWGDGSFTISAPGDREVKDNLENEKHIVNFYDADEEGADIAFSGSLTVKYWRDEFAH